MHFYVTIRNIGGIQFARVYHQFCMTKKLNDPVVVTNKYLFQFFFCQQKKNSQNITKLCKSKKVVQTNRVQIRKKKLNTKNYIFNRMTGLIITKLRVQFV